MAPKLALEGVDMLLGDLTQTSEIFGGTTVVLGTGFRHIPPVVSRGSKEIVFACIRKSMLWQNFKMLLLTENMRAREGDSAWRNFLLNVGNGVNNFLEIADQMLCQGDLIGNISNQNQMTDLVSRA